MERIFVEEYHFKPQQIQLKCIFKEGQFQMLESGQGAVGCVHLYMISRTSPLNCQIQI